jgi:hypothetical protein
MSRQNTTQQALQRLRKARLNAPPRTSAEAYAQMDRMLAAQKMSGATSSSGPRVKN